MHNAQKEIVERIIEKEVVRVRLSFSFPSVAFVITTLCVHSYARYAMCILSSVALVNR